jgi:outer membrane protein assembly factor BamD
MEKHVRRGIDFACLGFGLLLVGLAGCGKEGTLGEGLSPEEQFAYTKRMFDKRDFYKAKMQFTVLVLNNPGSRIIEDAQFYLAECHFNLKEYLLAAAEYEKLIKSLPQSAYGDDARYKIGLCYEKLSPGYSLDQEYTLKAISQYQQFLEEHPESELRSTVEQNLKDCRNKIAQKEYKTGELYRKMGYHSSALISFNAVLENFYDTDFADDALYWKGFCLGKLGNGQEARAVYEMLLAKYPDSEFADPARERLKGLATAKS